MLCYKLTKVIDAPITVNVATLSNGITKYGHMVLEPNKVYQIPENNPVLENSLRNATTKHKWNEQLEANLKKNGVPYEVKMCPACGGRAKKIEYHLVEVFENA